LLFINPLKEQVGKIFMPVDDTKENLNICMNFCGTCPSLPVPPNPFLFCARGASKEKIERVGCKCPTCDVYKKYNLSGDPYYCEHGKAL
jgi:hypothetical protein